MYGVDYFGASRPTVKALNLPKLFNFKINKKINNSYGV